MLKWWGQTERWYSRAGRAAALYMADLGSVPASYIVPQVPPGLIPELIARSECSALLAWCDPKNTTQKRLQWEQEVKLGRTPKVVYRWRE